MGQKRRVHNRRWRISRQKITFARESCLFDQQIGGRGAFDPCKSASEAGKRRFALMRIALMIRLGGAGCGGRAQKKSAVPVELRDWAAMGFGEIAGMKKSSEMASGPYWWIGLRSSAHFGKVNFEGVILALNSIRKCGSSQFRKLVEATGIEPATF